MTKQLRIVDIDAFSEAGSVPEAAISDDILTNIRRLDERLQLEPWIQEIIGERDETHHGPTEIADVVTTRLILNGKPKFAAILLKGKSNKGKVTSKVIAHQLLRLKQLPQLQVVALMAVGDIQDDAKRDTINIADELGADCLIASGIDVARLLIAKDFVCAKDGLPFVSGQCPMGHDQRAEIKLNYSVRGDLVAEIGLRVQRFLPLQSG